MVNNQILINLSSSTNESFCYILNSNFSGAIEWHYLHHLDLNGLLLNASSCQSSATSQSKTICLKLVSYKMESDNDIEEFFFSPSLPS